MPHISWDDRSFIVGSRRIWIVSGAIHYFRVPRPLWGDRLLKLKRAGCNTVETYVAWNFHERREGTFDFSGDADLEAFISLAEEMGLWVIVRPGPYICSEWDNGGLPAWLNAKESIRLREANPVYHRYIRRWFEELMPIIARHQVTRGGGVILVQDENEYCFRNRPGGREHIIFIRDLMRSLDIDVPIVVCNMLYERVSGTIECWNGWKDIAKGIDTLEAVQPNAPRLVTEFWDGWYQMWGKPPVMKAVSPRDLHANSLLVLAKGAGYSYYMFHGGTNFGAFPGRSWHGVDGWITTSYDYAAPVSETGALTDKYYAAKLASTLASNLESFFGDSEQAHLPVTSSDDVEILSRKGPHGHIIFVFNRGRRKTAQIHLPGGAALNLSFRDLDALALPYNFSPVPGFTIEHSNLSLLGMMPIGVGRLVFLHGSRGAEAVLAAQGRRFSRKVSREAQVWFGNFPNLVAMLDFDQARRTWLLSDRAVVGADYVAEVEGESIRVGNRRRDATIVTYFPNGKVNFCACGGAGEAPALPKLTPWKKKPLLPRGRPSSAVLITDDSGSFRPPESLGYIGGYGLYHTRIKASKGGVRTLLFADAEDRLTVFSNGRCAGVFGRGKGATTGLIEVRLKKGPNDLHVLLDNLGRAHIGLALGETKGIRGPVAIDARKLRHRSAWTAGRYNGKLAKTWQIETWWPEVKGIAATLSAVFSIEKGESVVLRLAQMGEPAAIFVNRRFHSYFWAGQELGRRDILLDSESLDEGKNLIEIAFFVAPDTTVKKGVSLFAFRSENTLVPWYFAALEAPRTRLKSAISAQDAPVAWETKFRLSKPSAPVVLATDGLKKGEVWLNGRFVGRHWHIGPERRTYLPEPWLEATNTLVVVDETGARPTKVRLEYDKAAAMHMETVT